MFIGACRGSTVSGDNNVFIGYGACDNFQYQNASNELCIGSGTNNLITGNFSSGILVLGNGSGYTHVRGDLYVSGTIYEGQTQLLPATMIIQLIMETLKQFWNAGTDDGASTASASRDSGAKTQGATEPGANEDEGPATEDLKMKLMMSLINMLDLMTSLMTKKQLSKA